MLLSSKIRAFLILNILILPFSLAETPEYRTNCPYKIISPGNGSGVYFDKTCTVAFVLPPKIGGITIGAEQQSLNLNLCKGLKDAQAAMTLGDSIRLDLLNRINKILQDYDPLKKDRDLEYQTLQKAQEVYDQGKIKFDQFPSLDI